MVSIQSVVADIITIIMFPSPSRYSGFLHVLKKVHEKSQHARWVLLTSYLLAQWH